MMASEINSRCVFQAILCALFLFVSAYSHAQSENASAAEEIAVPESLNPTSMQELVSKLEPEQVEALSSFLELLNKSAAESLSAEGKEEVSMVQFIRQGLSAFVVHVGHQITQFPKFVSGLGRAFSSIFNSRSFAENIKFIGLIALAIAVGMILEKGFSRLANAKREQIKYTKTDTLRETLKVLSLRGGLEMGGAIVLVVAALVIIRIVFSQPLDRAIASGFILYVVLIFRFAATLLKFVLAPQRTDLRLVSTDDWTAKYVYRNLVILAVFVGIALYIVALIGYFNLDGIITVRFWLGLLFTGWLVFVIWSARKGLTSIIIGEDSDLTPGLARMAAWWPPLAIAIIIFNWLLGQFITSTGHEAISAGRGALAATLIVVTPFLDTIVRGVSRHLVPQKEGEGAVAEKAHHDTEQCYVRVGRVVLLVGLVLILAALWGLSLTNLAEDSLGAQFASNMTGFLLIVAAGYMAWEITNLVINRKLARELEASGVTDDQESGEGGGAGLTRMATILPILRMTLQAAIIILTVLLALSQLGVNITPLLAGAGVLGLAIGFGAQTLVKDIVSGVFFLLDDAFRVGEYIDVGGTQGTVERISVRSLQLRAVLGPIHIIPYGSMSQLTNMSRDWVTMKLRFTIPFDTDLEKVRKLFKKIGQQMMEEPELADKFLAPFKGQGAADVTDTGIVVRGKFTTRPGDQWTVRKEVYNRVQRAFEENGIEFARKEVLVRLSDSDEHTLTPEQKEAIAAAASQAAEDEKKKPEPPLSPQG
ncbi:MAG: mechanosensitive ion channel family protein [bacterium]